MRAPLGYQRGVDDPERKRPGRRATSGARSRRHDLPARPHAVPDPQPDPDHVERQAIFAAQEGDNQPFARLLRTHDPALRTVATFLVGADSVDTVLHDAYLRAFRSIPRYRGEPMPSLWLTRSVVSVALDHLRKRHRPKPRRAPNIVTPEPPPPASGPGGDDSSVAPDPETGVRIIRNVETSRDAPDAGPRSEPAAEADPALQRLHTALDELLLEDRIALTLVDVAGMSVEQAAATIEVEHPTVASRLGRARANVQRSLTASHEEAESGSWSPVATPAPDNLAGWFDLQPVPAHGDAFWERVGAQLLDAKYRPAAPGPDPGRIGSVRTKRGPGDGTEPQGVTSTPTTHGGAPAVVKGLAGRSHLGRRARSSNLGRVVVVVIVLAALGGIVAGAFAIAGKVTHHDNQLGLTSSKVIDHVNDALAGDQVVTGTVAVDSGGSPVAADTYVFARSVDGSYEVTGSHWSEAYDASTGRFSTVGDIGNGSQVSLVQTGVAPGPPDPTAASFAELGDPLTAVVRLLRQGHNTNLTSLGDNGAPQYVLDADLSAAGSGPPSGAGVVPGVGAFATTGGADHVRVVIDQSLELPVDLQLTRELGPVMHLRFSNLSIAQAPPADAFRPAAHGAQTISRGFQTTALSGVQAAVGHAPLTPSYLPGGFTLATVATMAHAPDGATSTAANRNPPDQGVVVLTYRHGGDTIVITTRAFTSAAGKLWLDPFAATGTGASNSVTLTGGTFQQVGATSGDKPVAHLWGHDRTTVFTVAGDVSESQLENVASSLQ